MVGKHFFYVFQKFTIRKGISDSVALRFKNRIGQADIESDGLDNE